LNAGAFSDEKVVATAQKVVPILVDCSERGVNADLQKKYQVQGYPTVIFADAEGKPIKEMESRDPSSIIRDIDSSAQKNPGRPTLFQPSMKFAMDAAKRAKKPVGIFLADPKADLAKVHAKLMKDLGDRKAKLLWVLEPAGAETLAKYRAEAAPAVVVIDPKTENAVSVFPYKEDGKPADLTQGIDEALKSIKK
jgi:hypothetical protein